MRSRASYSAQGPKLGPTFERFTDRARRALVLAQEEGRLLNHNFIGTEHILLGLIHEEEGLAARALESLGISLEAAKAKVAETIGPVDSSPPGSPPFTPRAKKVLELALREALQLGHNYIGTEHMLLGLVREGEGVAAQVLVSLGADLDRVRHQVILLLTSAQPPGESAEMQARFPGLVSAPTCSGCGAELATSLGYRVQDVPADVVEGAETARRAVLWWCRACGHTLAVTPEAGPAAPGS